MNSRVKAHYHIIKNNICNLFKYCTYPRFAHFFITWACNLRCSNCKSWEKDTINELSTGEILNLIKKISFLDIIKITGGEPFLRDDLPEIVKGIKERINPYILQLTTNGMLTEKIVNLVKQLSSPNLNLRISLDGIGQIHDKIRGKEGCYQRVQETLKELIKLKKTHIFHLAINYGLRKETVPFVEEVHAFCRTNKIGLVLGYPIKPFLENVDLNYSPDQIDIPDEIVKVYKNSIFRQQPANIIESFISNIINRIFVYCESHYNYKFDCGELRDLMYILPSGDIVLCGLRQKKVGNLIDNGFEEIWFADKIKYYREEINSCTGCLQKAIKLASKIYKVF